MATTDNKSDQWKVAIKDSLEYIMVSFDFCGNIYFNIIGNSQLYDLTITNKDDILCEKYIIRDEGIDIIIKQVNPLFGNIKLTDDPFSLKGKTQKQYKKELAENNDGDGSDSDDNDPEYSNDKEYNKLYGEDEEYTENVDEIDSDEDPNNEYFVFLSGNVTVPIIERETSNALYDTILYESNYANYKTKLIGNDPIYRLKVYKSGEVKFRPIGKPEKNYIFVLKDDDLFLQSNC